MREKLASLWAKCSPKDILIGLLVLLLLLVWVRPHFSREGAQTPLLLSKEQEVLQTTAATTTPEGEQAPAKKAAKVVVHVSGAVEAPGVYELSGEGRVNDAIQRAKPRTDADLDALNLAQVLNDGDKIAVPVKGAVPAVQPASATGVVTAQGGDGAVSLNQSDETALQTLPGIGPAKAKAIIQYRQEHGGFKSLEELKEVPGIGEKTYSQLADQIRL